jgi:hypothetical protein
MLPMPPKQAFLRAQTSHYPLEVHLSRAVGQKGTKP